MSVKKLLPIARKMGEENFLAYKKFAQNVKKADGQQYTTTLNLVGVNIMDTISITPKDGMTVPKGIKELLKEIYAMYFPRAASQTAQKDVTLTSQRFNKDSFISTIEATTSDKNGIIGKTVLNLKKAGKQLETNIETFTEDVKLKLSSILNFDGLKPNERKQINLPWHSLQITELKNDIKISLNPPATKDMPKLNLEAILPKKMIESFFNGKFENSLPSLAEKVGFQF